MSKEHIATLQEAIDRYRSRDYADDNLVRNYGQEFAEACLDALKFQASAPANEHEEREHCLTVARGWGLEGDRAHAQAYRLYEQRRDARCQGYDTGHLAGWRDAQAKETFDPELVRALLSLCANYSRRADEALMLAAKAVAESERRVVKEAGDG